MAGSHSRISFWGQYQPRLMTWATSMLLLECRHRPTLEIKLISHPCHIAPYAPTQKLSHAPEPLSLSTWGSAAEQIAQVGQHWLKSEKIPLLIKPPLIIAS